MPRSTWYEVLSRYQATGSVDASGKTTNAEITDNHGMTIDRNRTFGSEAEFIAWAKRRAGFN